MDIREATDLSIVRALAQTIWREYYPAIIGSAQVEYMLESMYSLDALKADRARGVHFALVGDVGFVGCELVGDTCKLHKLYLLQRARGQGAGQAALAYVKAWAAARGAKRVHLNVNKHNVLAMRAYERAGYARLADVKIDIGGGFVMDDYVYELTLPGAA